jgi:hypothetical protein
MLAQAYEQSKMDEVRDTPVITIIQPPETPLMPDAKGIRTRFSGWFWVSSSPF